MRLPLSLWHTMLDYVIKPPIVLHTSPLSLLVRTCIEAEESREQVMAWLVPLTQAVWGYFYRQAPGEIIKHWCLDCSQHTTGPVC